MRGLSINLGIKISTGGSSFAFGFKAAELPSQISSCFFSALFKKIIVYIATKTTTNFYEA